MLGVTVVAGKQLPLTSRVAEDGRRRQLMRKRPSRDRRGVDRFGKQSLVIEQVNPIFRTPARDGRQQRGEVNR